MHHRHYFFDTFYFANKKKSPSEILSAFINKPAHFEARSQACSLRLHNLATEGPRSCRKFSIGGIHVLPLEEQLARKLQTV